MVHRVHLFLVLLLGSMACDPTAPDRSPTTSVSTATANVTPNAITPDVSVPTAPSDPRALAALGESTRAIAQLQRSPVPVLAPTNVTFERPTFVVGAEFYTLTGRVAGTTIAIQGTRAARRYEGMGAIAGDRVVRGHRGFVTVNEGIRTASWIEDGAAYSVDVECADTTDARCAAESFALEIVEHLALAGGRR